ncbi:MAG: hypothetical protein ACTH0C_11805 [Actinomycetaceae bacterium]
MAPEEPRAPASLVAVRPERPVAVRPERPVAPEWWAALPRVAAAAAQDASVPVRLVAQHASVPVRLVAPRVHPVAARRVSPERELQVAPVARAVRAPPARPTEPLVAVQPLVAVRVPA